MEKMPITKAGFEKLKKELDQLKRVLIPENIKAIEEARGHGDISENAEYHAAREKQGLIEAKIRDLDTKLATCEIVELPQGPRERVCFGCRVKIEDLDSGEVKTYRIVGPYEADIDQGLLSVTSPLARSLIGKGKDDDIVVSAPGSVKEYEILEIGA